MADLRLYQQRAVDAVLTAWATGLRRLLIVSPTGSGKTLVFAKVAEAMRPHGRVLVLAHREELIRQAQEKIAAWTGLTTGVEMGDERAHGFMGQEPDVVVASVQTLARAKRRATFDPAAFGLVIVDEAHHAPAPSYRAILEYFNGCRVLGCTATPDRLDKQGLKGVFEAAPFVYELRDAIADGWLAPITQQMARIDRLDLSEVRSVAGDFVDSDLEEVMLNDAVLYATARAIAERSGDRPTLVFTVTVAHAHRIADALRDYMPGDAVEALSGEDNRDRRRAMLARFRAGGVRVVANCLLFTEGFDEPSIACIAVLRPTQSRSLYQQMIGRGSRLHPGKTDCLVIDLAGNAGKHRLVNSLDVLGTVDPTVRARAVAKIAGSAGGMNPTEALAQVESEMAAELRRRSLEASRRYVARYTVIDPFAVLQVPPAGGRWGGIEPTVDQIETLREHKVDQDLDIRQLDRGQAEALLTAIRSRRIRNLCTYKQARVLLKFGYDPDVDFATANRIITRLAANNWRRLASDAPTAATQTLGERMNGLR